MIVNSELDSELRKLNSTSLEAISGVRLMNRFEVKYVFTTRKLTDLVNLLGKYYQVLEINDLKILPYSTTYFDTADHLFLYQHVRGISNRYKMRYRRYEATNESFLEIKKRTNKGLTIKWRIPNEPENNSFDCQAASFIREYLPVSPGLVTPVMINQFSRITLAGYELKERITIDFNISFSTHENKKSITLPNIVIAELKKEMHSDSSHFKNLIKMLKIYPTGFSKYCVGSVLLDESLKKNVVKPKLLLINKLENECTSTDFSR